MLDWLDCIDEMARLPFPMVIWRHGFYVSILCRGIVATAKMATGGLRMVIREEYVSRGDSGCSARKGKNISL